jgi:hypothetical protein
MPEMKPPNGMICAWLVLLGLGGPVAFAQSHQPEPPGDPSARPAETTRKSAWLHEVFLREASEYEFYLDDEKQQKLELRREPVMRYSSGGEAHGEAYIWTHQGRPEIIGSIFSQPLDERQRRVMHEFHSLSLQALVNGKPGSSGSGWQPQEPGITLAPVPDAPEPARTEARRLVQMRDLARRFSAHMFRQDSQLEELRLLPQPLFRYEPAADSPVVDGALFAYVWATIGTDPEVLLVIEARRRGGSVQWQYAPVRFTNREAWVNYQKREVWRVPPVKFGGAGMTSRPYAVFTVKAIPNQVEAP